MTLAIHVLPPSPNNLKVGIALAYKGIEHERHVIDPEDRSALVELSGQPLTPVIDHDGHVLFDSSAILRYLDANFPGPKLFRADREEMHAIDRWGTAARATLGAPLGAAFGLLRADPSDAGYAETLSGARAAFHEAAGQVEAALEGRDWLVGDSLSAADIEVATMLVLSAIPAQLADFHPLWNWFGANFQLGEGRDRCRSLVERVFALLPTPVA
ncbi:MAG: glutathione S-transferase family protein [Planctomycetota bacterium]|nr:glutathione S-transferase family protein [Planctomycetota bacterium]